MHRIFTRYLEGERNWIPWEKVVLQARKRSGPENCEISKKPATATFDCEMRRTKRLEKVRFSKKEGKGTTTVREGKGIRSGSGPDLRPQQGQLIGEEASPRRRDRFWREVVIESACAGPWGKERRIREIQSEKVEKSECSGKMTISAQKVVSIRGGETLKGKKRVKKSCQNLGKKATRRLGRISTPLTSHLRDGARQERRNIPDKDSLKGRKDRQLKQIRRDLEKGALKIIATFNQDAPKRRN